MAEIVSEFFQITGLEQVPPETLAELIPWIATIFVGVALVCAVFGVVGKLAEVLLSFLRWRD